MINIEIELMEEQGLFPTMPTHSGTQHDNIGLDIYAAEQVDAEKIEDSFYVAKIRTGIRVKLPDKYHMEFHSRSGLGFKNTIFN